MNTGGTPTLLLATSNPGKRREFAALLPPEVRLVDLAAVGIDLPPESGTSFATNAAAKAIAATAAGLPSLADDSGLEVLVLGGAPGICSARFAGEPPDDERNRRALLAALADVEPVRRGARFVCSVAFADAGRVIAMAEGTCRGMIADAPRGERGFGYDPIFVLPNGRTMAEISAEQKNAISHRGLAYRRLLPVLLSRLGLAPGSGSGG